jgi:hypothetical protein
VKKIAFTGQARADVRRLDIPTAMRIFDGYEDLIRNRKSSISNRQ